MRIGLQSPERGWDRHSLALAKYSRGELVAMAEQPSPSEEWGSWCTDAILFVAHKHVMDGQPIHVVRLGHATAEKCLKKKDGQHE